MAQAKKRRLSKHVQASNPRSNKTPSPHPKAPSSSQTAPKAASAGRKAATTAGDAGVDDSKKALHEKIREANKFIKDKILAPSEQTTDLDIVQQYETSQFALGSYVTLDWQHIGEITALMQVIRDYARDRSRKRPLNIIMQAEPGSGKSHFIKCLAQKMSKEGIDEVTFNMTSMQGVDDLIQPLEAVRNLKVVDKLPILFLDEFDSKKEHYALLLPLLWDGELSVGHNKLRLGKAVIILAGSGAHIEKVMKTSKGMRRVDATEKENDKLADLLSRINGGELTIPGLDEVGTERDRRVDKVCLTLSLLSQRFGSKLSSAPWAFLKFVGDTKFQHGVRSINHLIDLIPSTNVEMEVLRTKDLHLPLGTAAILRSSSLAYHLLAEDGPAAVVEAWRQLKVNEASVKFNQPLRWRWLEFLNVGRA